jgi:hypothetical protein
MRTSQTPLRAFGPIWPQSLGGLPSEFNRNKLPGLSAQKGL